MPRSAPPSRGGPRRHRCAALYLLQRAQPGLYELFQTYAKKAEIAIEIANKSCEQMEAEIKAGKDPYDYYKRLAQGEAWKQEASVGVDVVQAKENVAAADGRGGIPMAGWNEGWGAGMPAIRPVFDTVLRGLQHHAESAIASRSRRSPLGSVNQGFATPAAASAYAVDVLGDMEVATQRPCRLPDTNRQPGLGLTHKFEQEIPTATAALNTAWRRPCPAIPNLRTPPRRAC